MAEWPKTINVDKKIVPLLSEATYTDIYQVIREFVNNSYDADALRVEVNINLDSKPKFIEIIDDGTGMTSDEFGSNFLTIAHTPKLLGEKTKYGRPTIGKFGVGFLSATRFCKKLKIESKVEGDPEIFEATINCEKFYTEDIRLVWQIPVPGRTYSIPSIQEKNYTKVTLDDLTPYALSFFEEKKKRKKMLSSIKGWKGEDALKWKLQQILPLEYNPKADFYSKYLKHDFGTPMEVFLNGEKLFRNKLEGEVLFNGHEKIGNDVEFKYVILTPWKTVNPMELIGLQTRINNVGIGLPHLFGASSLTGHQYLTTRWISGEIQVIGGLDEFISISRNEFNESVEYNDFYNFLHERVVESLNLTETERPSSRKLSKLKKKIGNTQETLISMKLRKDEEIKISKSALLKEKKKYSTSLKDQVYEKLGKPGIYKVETEKYSGDLSQNPIILDKKDKKLKIVENHPALKEHIFIQNKDFIVEYDAWETPPEEKKAENAIDLACKINVINNNLIFNKKFLLFQDKTYSDLYKEVFAILAYATIIYPENKKINNFIAKILTTNYLIKEGVI